MKENLLDSGSREELKVERKSVSRAVKPSRRHEGGDKKVSQGDSQK